MLHRLLHRRRISELIIISPGLSIYRLLRWSST